MPRAPCSSAPDRRVTACRIVTASCAPSSRRSHRCAAASSASPSPSSGASRGSARFSIRPSRERCASGESLKLSTSSHSTSATTTSTMSSRPELDRATACQLSHQEDTSSPKALADMCIEVIIVSTYVGGPPGAPQCCTVHQHPEACHHLSACAQLSHGSRRTGLNTDTARFFTILQYVDSDLDQRQYRPLALLFCTLLVAHDASYLFPSASLPRGLLASLQYVGHCASERAPQSPTRYMPNCALMSTTTTCLRST